MIYRIKRGDTLSKIARQHDIPLNQLLALNPHLKANPNLISVDDKIIVAAPIVEPEPKSTPPVAPSVVANTADDFNVRVGQLTFDAEGMEIEGPYFSRTPHVPGGWSGVTIGRGYDMKERSTDEIIADLTASGVPNDIAKKFGECSGLMGNNAEEFLIEKNYEELLISPAQQKRLFIIAYQELEGDVKRICTKADVEAKYGETHWDTLNQLIKDVVVDLRYRGDYTPATRQRVQPLLIGDDNGDLLGMSQLMANKRYWVRERRVPLDRYKRRMNYLANV
ncbi:pesticin C-terminus-like muramidase [Pseudomonadota bacterium]